MEVKSSPLLGVGRKGGRREGGKGREAQDGGKKGQGFHLPSREGGKNIKKGVIHFVQLPGDEGGRRAKGGGRERRFTVIANSPSFPCPSYTLLPASHSGAICCEEQTNA